MVLTYKEIYALENRLGEVARLLSTHGYGLLEVFLGVSVVAPHVLTQLCAGHEPEPISMYDLFEPECVMATAVINAVATIKREADEKEKGSL